MPTEFNQPGTQTAGYVTPAGFDANSFNHWSVYWSVYAGTAGYVTYLDQLDYMLDLTQDQYDWLFAHKNVTHEITYELQENDYSDEAVMASYISVELAREGFFSSFSESVLDFVLDKALPYDLQPYAAVFKAYLKYQVAIERQKDPSASSLRIYWRASQELLHTGLDFAGLVPAVGEIFDLANGLTYAISGDWSNATLSLASAVPILGDIPATARIIQRGKELIALRAGDTFLRFTRNSEKFRKLLGLVPGDGMIAHHVIPLELETHALVQMAARNGFDMNAVTNGKALSQAIHSTGSHNAYSTRVANELNVLWQRMPPSAQADPAQAMSQLQGLINRITNAINSSPNTPINNLTF